MNSNPSPPPDPKVFWWGLLCGPGVMFLGFCAFDYFSKLETGEREPIDMPSIFVLLYNVGGKWFAAILIMGLGAIVTIFSAYELFFQRKASRKI